MKKNSPKIDPGIFSLDIPVLGICYGMQFMVHSLGGIVERASKREYGFAEFTKRGRSKFLNGIDKMFNLLDESWRLHYPAPKRVFNPLGSTENTAFAAAANAKKKLFGLQFHPEVEHTAQGKVIIRNFLFDICRCKGSWTMKSFAKESVEAIRQTVGNKKVILGLSGESGFFGGRHADSYRHRQTADLYFR